MKERETASVAAVATVLALSLGAGAIGADAQTPVRIQVAVIDVQRILSLSTEGKREIAKIKQVEEGKAAELAQLEADINKLKDRLTDLGFSISDDERTKLQREIEDKVIYGERYRKDSLREIKGMYEDVLAAFEKRIGPIVSEIGSARGIQIIFHRDNPVIAWADKTIDITQEVIERFDKASGGK